MEDRNRDGDRVLTASTHLRRIGGNSLMAFQPEPMPVSLLSTP